MIQMNNEILKILGEIDSITRDEFSERRIGYEAYVEITTKLAHLNKMIKSSRSVDDKFKRKRE